MKKLFIIFAVALQFIFLNSASAKMIHVGTDANGYNTYFDSDSISVRSGEQRDSAIISVRVIGYRPDGSVIMDIVEEFMEGFEMAPCFRLNKESKWTLVDKFPAQKKIFDKIMEWQRKNR